MVGVIRVLVVLAAVAAIAPACASVPPASVNRAIAGQVVGADGRALEGVRVVLQPIAAPAPVLSAADPMVRTDAEGRFSFDTPPAGRHQILLLHPVLGWLIAQGATPGPPVRLIFDGKMRVIDISRRK
jgi:hypothetical protein